MKNRFLPGFLDIAPHLGQPLIPKFRLSNHLPRALDEFWRRHLGDGFRRVAFEVFGVERAVFVEGEGAEELSHSALALMPDFA